MHRPGRQPGPPFLAIPAPIAPVGSRPWWRAACALCWAAAAHDRHTAAQARQSRLPGSPWDECRHRDRGRPQAGQRGRCDRHQDLPGSAAIGRQAHGGGFMWAVAWVVMCGAKPRRRQEWESAAAASRTASGRRPGCDQRTEQPPVNANDATLTELATAQSGSMVGDDAPNAPAGGGFDLIIGAVAGSALGSSGAPYTLTVSAIDLTTVSQPWPPQNPPPGLRRGQRLETQRHWPRLRKHPDHPQHHPGRPGRPPGRPHPAIRGLPDQPGRPDRHHPPKRPIRPRLTAPDNQLVSVAKASDPRRPRTAGQGRTAHRLDIASRVRDANKGGGHETSIPRHCGAEGTPARRSGGRAGLRGRLSCAGGDRGRAGLSVAPASAGRPVRPGPTGSSSQPAQTPGRDRLSSPTGNRATPACASPPSRTWLKSQTFKQETSAD